MAYEERVKLLLSVGVAVWDTLHACIRPGSLDAGITDEVANDFYSFLIPTQTSHMCFSTVARQRGHFAGTHYQASLTHGR